MDVYFNLDCITETMASYNSILMQTSEVLLMADAAISSIDYIEWNGDGKEAFVNLVKGWLSEYNKVFEEIVQTSKALRVYAACEGNELKLQSEHFASNL